MKILFIGNANSFLIRSLARKLKENDRSLAIDILSDQVLIDESHPFNKVKCINHTSKIANAKYIKAIYYAAAFKNKLKDFSNDYDAVHILYVSVVHRFVWKWIKSKARKVIITVFGGDYYKATSLMRSMLRKPIAEADIVTGSNARTLQDFGNFFQIEEGKRRLCHFGLSVLDEIDVIKDTDIVQFKKQHNIPTGSKVIACGSNASINQNLSQIVEQLKRLKTKSETFLTFQFHAVQNDRINELLKNIEALNIPFKIFNNRFSDKELAVYRKAVDVFIQLQTTDQFSGAMQEHLYAGSMVITGKWLPYTILDDNNTDYIRIESINNLGDTLNSIGDRKVNADQNRQVIANISKWDVTVKEWRSLYD